MTTHTAQKTHRVNCLTVARHLQKDLNNRSKNSSERGIRRHLRMCPNCAAYFDSLKKTVSMYRKAPCPRLPKRVREDLFRVLKLGRTIH